MHHYSNMPTNIPNKVLRIVVVTTEPDFDTHFTSDLRLIEYAARKMEGATVENIQVVKINAASLGQPDTELNENGKPIINHAWYERNITNKYRGNGNIVLLHLTEAERLNWGLSNTINGLYWNDKNDFMECYVIADKGRWSDRTKYMMMGGQRVRLSQFARICIHEIGHGVVHFTNRKGELNRKYGTDDPVHYFDYQEKNVAGIYDVVSFKVYSILAFILSLQQQLFTMLKKEPIVATPQSRLEDWAKAIEKFEDYVPAGGRFRGGKLSVDGSVSWRNKNPGNLRWSIYEAGNRNNFSYFKTYEDGWKALLHQLRIAADGRSSVYRPTMTLREFFHVYAPSEDNNFPDVYAQFVADYLKVPVTTQIKNLI